MKHRKISMDNEPSIAVSSKALEDPPGFARPPDSSNSIDLKLHGHTAIRCAGYTSKHVILFILGILFILITKSAVVIYLNNKKQSPIQQLILPPLFEGNRLRGRDSMSEVDHPLLPFSTLLSVDNNIQSTTYGEKPLIGAYTIDDDNKLVKGTVEYPAVDLSTLLDEEAMTGGSIFQQAITVESSFLDDAVAFQSVTTTFNNMKHPDHALVSRQGFKMGKVPNQDRSLIANFYSEQPTEMALLMGIFDGHGGDGHKTSHFIALNFLKLFTDNVLKEKVDIEKALRKTFLDLDEHEPAKGGGGSTCSVLFYPGYDSKVYIANAGDSTTLIAAYSKSQKKSTIVYQNRKHKPHLADEKQRVEAAGGQVMIPPSLLQEGGGSGGGGLGETSRVIIPSADGNPFGGLALAMSRSIGDADGKKVGLIADPEIDVWPDKQQQKDTTDAQYFAISASDGLYDVISPEMVVNYLGKSLFEEGSVSPLEACERLIREASRLWKQASGFGMQYRDDITVGASKIKFVTSR